MDASKRSGITQCSALKIPYKSLTEGRIRPGFTSGLIENLIEAAHLWLVCDAMCKKWIKLKLHLEKKGSGWSVRIPNDEVFALRIILNVTLVMRRPQRPSDPGWVPPIALSSCSGERIKRVSLTGLTSSLLLHQSEGSKVRSIGSPWPTVCSRAKSPINRKWDCYTEPFSAEIGASGSYIRELLWTLVPNKDTFI